MVHLSRRFGHVLLGLALVLPLPVLGQGVTEIWAVNRPGTTNATNRIYALDVDSNGDVMVTGKTGSPGDIYTARYASATGTLIWERLFNHPSGGADAAFDISIDGSGNVYVIGTNDAGADTANVVKYAGANGTQLWHRTVTDSTPGVVRTGSRLAISPAGGIFAVGSFYVEEENEGWTVTKFSSAGTQSWDKKGPSETIASAIATDSSGNLVVTGRVSGYFIDGNRAVDFSYPCTAKYAGSNGDQLWVKYEHPDDPADVGGNTGVAVGASGNVYAVSEVKVGSGNIIRVTKRSGADGAILWSNVLVGAGANEGGQLKLDGEGNVLVSATINSTTGLLAKLSLVDGAILWSVTAPDTVDRSGTPRLAFDSQNNIVAATHLGFGAKFRSSDGAILNRGTAGSASPGISTQVDPFDHFVVGGNFENGSILTKYGPVTVGRYTAPVRLPGNPGTANIGLLSITVTNQGTVYGEITFGKTVYAIAGKVGYLGALTFGADETPELFEIPGLYGQPNMTLSLAADGERGVVGTLTRLGATTDVAEIQGNIAPYSKTALVPEPMLNRLKRGVPHTGVYNLAIHPKVQTPELDPGLYPQGHGFATVTLTNFGAIRIVGRLADGTRFTAASELRVDGTASFYAPLYKSAGCLAGELSFENLADSDLTATHLVWARPPRGNAPALYPQGWPGGIDLDAVGTQWNASPDFGQGVADPINGNASLEFQHGFLPSLLAKAVSVDPVKGTTRIPVASRGTTLAFTKSNGLFRGAFKHADKKAAAYSGIMLNKGATRGGYGYFLKKPTTVSGEIGQSGEVILDPAGP